MDLQALLASSRPPTRSETRTGEFHPDELRELEKIETSLRFLKLTRPKTDEYLEQKAQETEQLKRLRQSIVKTLSSLEDLGEMLDIKDSIERRKSVIRKIEALVEVETERVRPVLTQNAKRALTQDAIDEVLGLGPIEQLVRDDGVSEIMVNGPDQVFAERRGRLELTPIRFDDDPHLRRVIDRIVSPIGRRVDESSPVVDARLADGSRVNAVIPPIALDGSSLTIRKFARVALGIEDLVAKGSLTRSMALFLKACVEAHQNIVISGGTGSGKTTLLNILAGFIPRGERIVTIEDAAELQVKAHHGHVVRLEARPANMEGRGTISIRDLVRNTLRMRPDRIVVGECRGGEALDMLQAMNTGHDGSLTTGHANTPRDMLRRLETMVKMSGVDLPIAAIREQIASAVHLIVQANRLSDGSRRVTCVSEVAGIDASTEQILMRDIFVFEQTGVDERGSARGAHRATGHVPACVAKFRSEGIEFDEAVFAAGADA